MSTENPFNRFPSASPRPESPEEMAQRLNEALKALTSKIMKEEGLPEPDAVQKARTLLGADTQ